MWIVELFIYYNVKRMSVNYILIIYRKIIIILFIIIFIYINIKKVNLIYICYLLFCMMFIIVNMEWLVFIKLSDVKGVKRNLISNESIIL